MKEESRDDWPESGLSATYVCKSLGLLVREWGTLGVARGVLGLAHVLISDKGNWLI